MTSARVQSFKLYKSGRFVDRIRTRVSERRAHRDLGSALSVAGALWSEVEFAY